MSSMSQENTRGYNAFRKNKWIQKDLSQSFGASLSPSLFHIGHRLSEQTIWPMHPFKLLTSNWSVVLLDFKLGH